MGGKAAVHSFFPFLPLHPASETVARPKLWYLIVLSVSTAMWIAGPTAMFLLLYTDISPVSEIRRRRPRGIASEGDSADRGEIERMCIATACSGSGAL